MAAHNPSEATITAAISVVNAVTVPAQSIPKSGTEIAVSLVVANNGLTNVSNEQTNAQRHTYIKHLPLFAHQGITNEGLEHPRNRTDQMQTSGDGIPDAHIVHAK
jgi:hypothetical protein